MEGLRVAGTCSSDLVVVIGEDFDNFIGSCPYVCCYFRNCGFGSWIYLGVSK